MIARATRINYSQDLNWPRSCTSVQYPYVRILTVSEIRDKLKILGVPLCNARAMKKYRAELKTRGMKEFETFP